MMSFVCGAHINGGPVRCTLDFDHPGEHWAWPPPLPQINAPTPSPTEPQTEPERCVFVYPCPSPIGYAPDVCGRAADDPVHTHPMRLSGQYGHPFIAAPTPTATDEDAFIEAGREVSARDRAFFYLGIAYARRKDK